MGVSTENKAVVYIVDNNEGYVERAFELLVNAGFEVTAISPSKRGLEEIVSAAPDLVLTGVRNADDRDPSDESGLSLASFLVASGVRAIVTSSTANYRTEAQKRQIPFVGKEEGPSALLAMVTRVLSE